MKTGLRFALVRLVVFGLFAVMQWTSPEASFLIFFDVPAMLLLWGFSAVFGFPSGVKDLVDPWFLAAALIAWFAIGWAIGALRKSGKRAST